MAKILKFERKKNAKEQPILLQVNMEYKPGLVWNQYSDLFQYVVCTIIETVEDFTSLNFETAVKEWITAKEIGFGKVMQPFRLSLVGELKGPHLFDIAEMIGNQETIERIKKAIASLHMA